VLEKGKPAIRLLPAVKLARARALRRNQTAAEAKLWRLLHSRRLCDAKFVATIQLVASSPIFAA